MRTRNQQASSEVGLEPGTARGRKSASDALRQEAERGWAESDRKAAKGRLRTQAAVKLREKARERDAEVQRLRGKLAQVEGSRGRKAK